jgi:DNA-binding transcriptional LysR family regulator
VSDMQAKIDALLRGIGCGFVPEPMVRAKVAAGWLVIKSVQRTRLAGPLGYAWRTLPAHASSARKPQLGLALRWWLERLEHAETRRALLERYGNDGSGAS